MAAIAATVLVIAAGALFAKAGAQARQESHNLVASNADKLRDTQQMSGFTGGNQTATQPANSAANSTTTNAAGDPGQVSNPAPNRTNNSGRSDITLPEIPQGNRLPNPPEGQIGGSLPPAKVELPDSFKHQGKNTTMPPGPSTSSNPSGRDGDDPTPREEVTKDSQAKPSDPGIVEISISKGNPAGGTLGNGKEALIHTARNQFQLGNNDAAARTYSRALRSGADQGSTNQRLGQCYERLGQTSEAIEAYQRAAAAYEADLKAGGDNPRVSAALESCRQAIKVLQGK
jgi:hypothetical protein